MSHVISHSPPLRPGRSGGADTGGRRGGLPEALGEEWRFSLGREAIHWAFRGLALPAGTPAWLPAFHCGVEVQAVIDAGFDPRFYDLDDELAVDMGELERGLRRYPGPVLLTHFFGWWRPEVTAVRQLCHQHGQLLVEDLSHALLSTPGLPAGDGDDGPRGSGTGDILAWSYRKVTGAVDGGGLRIDRDSVRKLLGRHFQAPLIRYPAVWPWLVLARRKLGLPIGDREPAGEVVTDRSPKSYRRTISPAGKWAVRTSEPAAITTRRRAAWTELHESLRDLLTPPSLPLPLRNGTVPLCFVISVPGRDALARDLLRDGVDPYIFGRAAHPELPPGYAGASRLRERLLGLPTHQGLTPVDLDRVEATARRHLTRHVTAAR